MESSKAATPPVVLWAQRQDKLLLTIEIEDCKEPEVKLDKDTLFFKGKSDSIRRDADHNEHQLQIEFYKPIKAEDSKHVVRARGLEFVIAKEELAWWPRLLKDTKKQHWLKVDFPKWKDEDDSDDDESGPGGMAGMPGMGGQPDFSELMQQFGSMPNSGDMADFDPSAENSDSSDDEEPESTPDLEG